MVIIHSLESVFTIIIMISIGYYLTHIKWLNEDISKCFAKIVINVALPAYMLSSLMTTFSKNKLESLAKGLFIPFLSIAICYFIALFVRRVLKIQKGRRGIFTSMFFNTNSIFVGLPVNVALFGSASLPYVFLYYIANTVYFWTLGVYCISGDAASDELKKKNRNTVIAVLKRVASPPLLGFIIAIILIMLNISLPKCIMDSLKYTGDLTTPLSMLFIGINMYNIKLRSIKFTKDIWGVFIGRFIASPLVVFLIVCFLPMPKLMKEVFIIQSTMPVMVNTAIVAKTYGADTKYASVMVTLTTIFCMVTIPILMVLFQHM